MRDDEILGESLAGAPGWRHVAPGTAVISSDGRGLGTVGEVQPNGLLVHGGLGGNDYLVPPEDIAHVSEDGVHLAVAEAEAMRAHWQGTSPTDETAPGGMAPGAMTREEDIPPH